MNIEKHRRARKPNRRGPVFKLVAFAALVTVAVHGARLRADDFPRRSYPLPVNIDTTLMRSELYLQFEARDFNISIEDFTKRSLSPEENVFVQAVQNIHNKNSAALAEIWGDPRPQKQASASSVQLSEITPKQVVSEYAADFVDLQKPKLVQESLVGPSTLFVWESSADGTPTRLGFLVLGDAKNKLWIKDVDSVHDPIANLIVLTLNELLRDPVAYKAAEKIGNKYRFAFPLAGKGNPGKHPVVLQFSGESLNFPVYDDRTAPPSTLLSSYRRAYLAFKNKKYDEFMDAHTPESKAKLNEFIPTLSGSAGAPIIRRMLANQYVKFVLNADPVHIVFYSALDGNDWPAGSLGYDYIFHDPSSGKFLLTNFMVQGFLDGVLRDPDLFNQLIFRPAIKADKTSTEKAVAK